MKALVYGSLNIDLIFSVDHIVAPGETISSSSLERSAGGKGANQAAALAKAGVQVYMAGKIGADGQFLLELLKSYGVNTEKVAVYGGPTGQAIIQLAKDGQNAIVLHAGGNGAIETGEIDGVLNVFGRDDIIVLQNEVSHVDAIIRSAKERGMKVCLNPSPCNDAIKKLPLNLVDLFFVNEIEGATLAGMKEKTPPREILDSLTGQFPNAEIILTVGKEGACYGHKEIREKGGIIDVPVVDTTAAGDTFTGYYIAARARGLPVQEALQAACKASSIAVSRKGAMESIPFASEVF